MTERTPEESAVADPTRDITLPPLPDRPPPALPKEWARLPVTAAPVDAPTTVVRGGIRPPVEPQAEPVEPEAEPVEPAAGPAEVESARRLASQRTDEHPPPPTPVRARTLAFSAPEMRHRPLEPVRVVSNPRRWPWVVLTLIPVLVILGAGVAWLILLRGM